MLCSLRLDLHSAVERKADVVLSVDRHMVDHVGPGDVVEFFHLSGQVLHRRNEHPDLVAARLFPVRLLLDSLKLCAGLLV